MVKTRPISFSQRISMTTTASVATEINAGIESTVGFDITPLIAILLPIFTKWFQGCQSPTPAVPAKTVQEVLAARYDASSGKYDRELISEGMSKARQDARHNHDPRVKNRELRIGVIATFDKARTADDAIVQSVMAENPV